MSLDARKRFEISFSGFYLFQMTDPGSLLTHNKYGCYTNTSENITKKNPRVRFR